MQTDLLDHRSHGGPRIAQPKRAPVRTQATSQDGQVEHQRRVAEHEVGEIDDDIPAGLDGAGERPPAVALCRPILVAATAQYRGVVIELDDPGNLHKLLGASKCKPAERDVFRVNGLVRTDETGTRSPFQPASAAPKLEMRCPHLKL